MVSVQMPWRNHSKQQTDACFFIQCLSCGCETACLERKSHTGKVKSVKGEFLEHTKPPHLYSARMGWLLLRLLHRKAHV